MPFTFRTHKTRTNPDTHKREPVLDGKGRKIPHPRWRFEYTDHLGRRRIGTGSGSKTETEALAVRIQAREDEIRKGYRPTPKSAVNHQTMPYSEAVALYLKHGQAAGGRGGRPWGKDHYRKRKDQLKWWGEYLGLSTLADLVGVLSRVETALQELQTKGSAPKTIQNYRESLAAFCDWLCKRGYLDSDPLENCTAWDTTPQTRRRPLTPDECQKLLASCRPQYRLLYEVALASGLRAGELRSLTVAHLDVKQGGLILDPAWTKDRRASFKELPRDLVTRLAGASAWKQPGDRLLTVPKHTAEVLYKDLARADIPIDSIGGRVDFHSLRTTFVNLVLATGCSVKEAMDASRHKTANLTMHTYGRSAPGRQSEIAEAVGKMVTPPPPPAETDTQPGTQRQVVGLRSALDSEGLMVRGGGFEPP